MVMISQMTTMMMMVVVVVEVLIEIVNVKVVDRQVTHIGTIFLQSLTIEAVADTALAPCLQSCNVN
jgi:hypothetical protein